MDLAEFRFGKHRMFPPWPDCRALRERTYGASGDLPIPDFLVGRFLVEPEVTDCLTVFASLEYHSSHIYRYPI